MLTGEIATGKSTLALELVKKYGFAHVKTTELLEKLALKSHTRKEFEERGFKQTFGAKLDQKTQGRWVVDEAQEAITNNHLVLVDAIRIKPQIEAFRSSFSQDVVHIHLTAPDDVKLQRFMDRRDKDQETTEKQKRTKYDKYKADETERQVNTLEADADLVIQTHRQSVGDNVTQAAAYLKLRAPILSKNVDVVIGGQFGSEGKGQIAAYLAPEYDCLIRVGGPNAGHKVYQEPTPHTFHLIPSGSHRNKKATIVIGPGAVVNLELLLKEISFFDVGQRIIIDENATVITNKDITDEQNESIGSTKKGVGAATANNLFKNRLLGSEKHKAKNYPQLKPYMGDAFEVYDQVLSSAGKILLEGTQGTFLDLHHGFYPYVTSRPTSASGCLAEAGIGPGRVDKVIVVARRYPIRVQNPEGGTSGPFAVPDKYFEPDISWKEVSRRSKIPESELVKKEMTTATNRHRRVAEFNWALFRKACELNTATDVAFTFSDYIHVNNRDARQFDQLTEETRKFIEKMERCSGVPVSLIATNFDFRAIVDRRKW